MRIATPPAGATDGRRHFLGLTAAAGLAGLAPTMGLVGCATPGSGSPGPIPAAARTATDDATDYRLANRLSWGANDAEIDRLRRLGRAAYIDEQLRAAAGPLPAEAQAQIAALRVQQLTPLVLWAEIDGARKSGEAQADEASRKAAQQAYQQALTGLAREAGTRHLLRAVYSPNQLLEQMQWFWFNHFNVHQYKANIRVLVADYEEQAIRPHALGRFRDLLGAVVHHPAMLRYLDNEQNAAGRINENLARELLELHTLGVDGGYAQRDVTEMARVLTGHGINLGDRTPNVKREQAALYVRNGGYEFNPNRHDFGDKNLLGRSWRGSGAGELDEVLDLLAAHPSTARFVCTKLARHLLADEPPPAVVGAMTQAWSRSGGRIDRVLAALVAAPAFTAAPAQKFKDPMHYVVSALRAGYGDRVVINTVPAQNWLLRMGQGLYNRQTPDGYPDTTAAWSSSGQLAVRLEIARQIGNGNTGLFRAEGQPAAGDPPQPPLLDKPIYRQVLRPLLAGPTRQALDAAATAQDWNALYLSAPDFMYC